MRGSNWCSLLKLLRFKKRKKEIRFVLTLGRSSPIQETHNKSQERENTMPRGIYDRSKTKEQREAEKAKSEKKSAKATTPKRKYTRRTVEVSGASSPTKAQGSDTGFFLMGEVRSNLASLVQVSDKFGDLPSVKSEIEAHVAVLGQLREKQFSFSDDTEVSADESVVEEEEVKDAPNGVTAPVRQASVPLPPPPPVAPALPTH